MGNIAIKAEDVSKAYQLGEFSTGTLNRDLQRAWAKMLGKEDPFLKIGETNDRTIKGGSDVVWSLKDVSFEIEKGDAVGIIGRNGAGKSTLLKILSKVTAPTSGQISGEGRIASLLEVGTGFHPELTGRENIFLNGAILGMRKHEIKRKFDEIVDFSGVERYIDTPVKRYSSGMYVRLAFAVAAHLESEILIVDEVLAVGDAEFQKKCLGKMGEVSKGEGRTVLFVSHNMSSIQILCNKGLFLSNGQVGYLGNIQNAVDKYSIQANTIGTIKTYSPDTAPGNEYAKILEVKVSSEGMEGDLCDITDEIFISVKYLDNNKDNKNTAIIHVKDSKDATLFATNEFNSDKWEYIHNGDSQIITATCTIPGNFLAEGRHTVLCAIGSYSPDIVHAIKDDIVSFNVVDKNSGNSVKKHIAGGWPGLLRPMLHWDITID